MRKRGSVGGEGEVFLPFKKKDKDTIKTTYHRSGTYRLHSGAGTRHRPVARVMEVVLTETIPNPTAIEKEGRFLLGSPTYVDLGNGRLRCEETGHELLAKDKDSYARNKTCRLALIDAALSKKKPPLNTFLPHPFSRSMLVCSLTGKTINKSEEHIWQHINGRRFLKKLEERELQPPDQVEKNLKERKQYKLHATSIKDHKVEDFMVKETVTGSTDYEESDFWIPPVGCHRDFYDGKDSWQSCTTSDQEAKANIGLDVLDGAKESESLELWMRTKRMAIAVGPSSFASRKKKNKRASEE